MATVAAHPQEAVLEAAAPEISLELPLDIRRQDRTLCRQMRGECRLLKYCHWQEDVEGHRMDLRYLRDTDGREVDFVVIKDRKPLFAVECKPGDKAASTAARYFAERTTIPVFYQVHLHERSFQTGKIVVLPFASFCDELKLP